MAATKKNDYYETLGVAKGATDDDLKKAYRKLAKQYHPDANPGDKTAEEKFKEINEAYSILSDPQKKAAYDQYGHSAFEQGGGGAGGGFYSGGGMDFNMNDIFESVFGGGFGDIFGGGRSSRNGPRRGSDVHANMRIKFEEAVFGTDKEIQLPVTELCETCGGSGAKPGTVAESCKHCGGTGQVRVQQQTILGSMTSVQTCPVCRGEGKIIKEPCQTCRGSGRQKKNKKLQINIPKGIDSNQTIRISGKGEPGERGGEYGDLLITVYVDAHKIFTRQGTNLYLDVPMTFVQATLGGDIIIPTMYGDERQTIKPGTQTGSKLVLHGKGVPNIKSRQGAIGDLIVTLNITVPTAVNERQKQLLREFADAMGDEYKDGKKSFKDKMKDAFK